MFYDECPAFEEPIEGDEALLLLKGRDDDLGAHLAVMGDGLLAPAHRERVLDGLTRG